MKPHAHCLMRCQFKVFSQWFSSIQFNSVFLYILPNYNNIHLNEHAFSQYDLLFLITSIFNVFCNHNGDGETLQNWTSETSGWHYCRCIHLHNCLWFEVIFQRSGQISLQGPLAQLYWAFSTYFMVVFNKCTLAIVYLKIIVLQQL